MRHLHLSSEDIALKHDVVPQSPSSRSCALLARVPSTLPWKFMEGRVFFNLQVMPQKLVLVCLQCREWSYGQTVRGHGLFENQPGECQEHSYREAP